MKGIGNVTAPVELTRPEASVNYAARAVVAVAVLTIAGGLGYLAGKKALDAARKHIGAASAGVSKAAEVFA